MYQYFVCRHEYAPFTFLVPYDITWVPGECRDHRRDLDTLNLGLEMVLNHHGGAEKETIVFYKISKCL